MARIFITGSSTGLGLMAGFVAQRWSISTALEVNGIALAVVALVFILKGTDLDAGLA